jgi:AcrR family transcriptional regulator
MTPSIDDPIAVQLATARRAQLLDAATRVFAEKGFHGATVRDIARVAGLADGTLYIYFKSKNELMLGILDRLNQSEERDLDLERAANGDFEVFLRLYIQKRFEVFTVMGFDVFRVIFSELIVNAELRAQYHAQIIAPTYDIAEAHIARWREQGWVASDEIDLATRCLSGLVMGILMLRMLGDPTLEQNWEKMPDVVANFILYGIRGKQS